MALERGFRRIVIVSSVVVFALGIAADVMFMLPHATVSVVLRDGREFALERHTMKEAVSDRDSLALALKYGEGVYIGGDTGRRALTGNIGKDLAAIPPPPDRVSAEDAATITTVKVVREPAYWWWSDSSVTKIAAVLIALLWVVFYAVRWIARGFARR